LDELHFLAIAPVIVPVDLVPHGFDFPASVLFFHEFFRCELAKEVRAHVAGKVPRGAAPVLNPPTIEVRLESPIVEMVKTNHPLAGFASG
jgi:hypothetical protein